MSPRNVTKTIGGNGGNYADVVWSSLLQVLCELQVAIIERGSSPRNNVSREVMSNEYRDQMSAQTTNRVIRDWLIFRDYMNGLEYIIQLLEHIRRDLKS
uniref:Uncharacterized protein n=1 Tax=Bracon brevicornis TaxID=1563983 RepID=A0A6V7LR45_9HYME